MSQLYRVSIPVEATTQDGVDVTITHKLEHGLVFGKVLSTAPTKKDPTAKPSPTSQEGR